MTKKTTRKKPVLGIKPCMEHSYDHATRPEDKSILVKKIRRDYRLKEICKKCGFEIWKGRIV